VSNHDPLCTCACPRSFHASHLAANDRRIFGACSGKYPSGRACVCREFHLGLGQVDPEVVKAIYANATLKEQKQIEAWLHFHAANPRFYHIFTRFSLEAALAGRKRFGANLVTERIRWYTAVESKGDDFKINNNWAPFYARLFEHDHPQHQGLFRLREAAADKVNFDLVASK
jgi:hypothetical protein